MKTVPRNQPAKREEMTAGDVERDGNLCKNTLLSSGREILFGTTEHLLTGELAIHTVMAVEIPYPGPNIHNRSLHSYREGRR